MRIHFSYFPSTEVLFIFNMKMKYARKSVMSGVCMNGWQIRYPLCHTKKNAASALQNDEYLRQHGHINVNQQAKLN